MSDLQNPLFDEEREFLERKKLEYERALRGDVDHIKDQSVKVGKLAAVGAGLAGGIWLITKALGSSKKKKRNRYVADSDFDEEDNFGYGFDQEAFDQAGGEPDDEFGTEYFTAGNGKRYKSKVYRRSAADSARSFADQDDDNGYGHASVGGASGDYAPSDEEREPSPYDTEDFEDDPFQDLPYDDSRRLPTSHAFDDAGRGGNGRSGPGSSMVGQVLQAFLKSDTGKVLVGQVAAVALALVTKKVSEFFPAPKNSDSASDLATSSGYAPVETGSAPVASSVSLDSPDASTQPQYS